MRTEFSRWIEQKGLEDSNMLFLTGDLGFNAFEKAKEILGERFINVGVAEQNMLGVAAGLAQQGLKPICYSIAPFLIFRAFEQIRVDVCLNAQPVKLVGNGGGYGYGIMGPTHHAIEDLCLLTSLPNMRCFIPFCAEEVTKIANEMFNHPGPAYLRLGSGNLADGNFNKGDYSATRQLLNGNDITIVGMGPILLNIIASVTANKFSADVFAINELPLHELSDQLLNSLRKTGKLLIIEEHVETGGLGQALCLLLMRRGLLIRIVHRFAAGYPGGVYGSQQFHRRISRLDMTSLTEDVRSLINDR